MSEQTLIQFRADKALKQEVAEIYESLGMDLNTALRMFLVRTKIENGLPFPATLSDNSTPYGRKKSAFDALRSEASDVPEMTLEEINAEIAAARAERKAGQ